MQFAIHRFKKKVLAVITSVSDMAIFIGIILIGGIGSSWYMVSAGTTFTTQVSGPWVLWTNQARKDADPYTRAHFARAGTLNLSTEVAATYVAYTDSDGVRLHSSCDYLIEGRAPDASWWSINVFDSSGRLIPNPIKRYAFSSDTIAISSNDQFTISLAREVQTGNWIPTGGAGRLAAVLTILESTISGIANPDVTAEPALPDVNRVRCR